MKIDCGIELVHLLQHVSGKSSAFALRENFGVESLTYLFALHLRLDVWASGINLPASLCLSNEIQSPVTYKQRSSLSGKQNKTSPPKSLSLNFIVVQRMLLDSLHRETGEGTLLSLVR